MAVHSMSVQTSVGKNKDLLFCSGLLKVSLYQKCPADSPKKQTNEFTFFAKRRFAPRNAVWVLKANSFIRFLGESEDTIRHFKINWPLNRAKKLGLHSKISRSEFLGQLKSKNLFDWLFLKVYFCDTDVYPSKNNFCQRPETQLLQTGGP